MLEATPEQGCAGRAHGKVCGQREAGRDAAREPWCAGGSGVGLVSVDGGERNRAGLVSAQCLCFSPGHLPAAALILCAFFPAFRRFSP